MKTKRSSILTVALAATMIFGTAQIQAALTMTWGAGTDDSFVLASSTIPTRIDVPLNSAAVAGVFSSAVSKSTFSAYTTAAQFLTGFTQLASSTIGNGTSLAGTFIGGGSIATGTDTYVGKQLYYIIGNASTIAASTQLGVFTKSTWLIPTNPTGPTPSPFVTDINQVTNDASSILFGGYLAGGGMTISGSTRADAYQLAIIIPEPSSASLLALGVAGLVALRVRRKS